MKFAKVLSRSGQSLLAARARGIANTVKQEQEALIADSKRKAQGITLVEDEEEEIKKQEEEEILSL